MHTLPKAWHGTWKGTLTIAPPLPGRPPSVAMELRIAPLGPDRVTWTLVYDGVARGYELAAGEEPDAFVLDEKNGIRMDAALDGETLHCPFEIDGTLLVSRYTLSRGTIAYEIRTYRRADTTSPVGGKNQVVAYKGRGVQRATLRRAGP